MGNEGYGNRATLTPDMIRTWHQGLVVRGGTEVRIVGLLGVSEPATPALVSLCNGTRFIPRLQEDVLVRLACLL